MKKRALVLCTGNSCRSQMAEAVINAHRGEKWEAFSAGTAPADSPNPNALQVLSEIDIQTQGSTPQHFTDYQEQSFDVIITLCDNAAKIVPAWPAKTLRKHISLPDPINATGTPEEVLQVYRDVRDDIIDKVLACVDTL